MTMHEFLLSLRLASENGELFAALERIRRSQPSELDLDSGQVPTDRRGWDQAWAGSPANGFDPER